jgi:hypothetical protein
MFGDNIFVIERRNDERKVVAKVIGGKYVEQLTNDVFNVDVEMVPEKTYGKFWWLLGFNLSIVVIAVAYLKLRKRSQPQ